MIDNKANSGAKWKTESSEARRLIGTLHPSQDPHESTMIWSQMLAWAKLSQSGQLPPTVRNFFAPLRHNDYHEFEPVISSFDDLEQSNYELFQGFGDRLRGIGFAFFYAMTADIQQYFEEFGREFSILADALIESAPNRFATAFVPREVAKLAVDLLGIPESSSFYCPFSNAWRFADQAGKHSQHVYWELDSREPFYTLLSLLTSSPTQARVSDPIVQPSFMEHGELQSFDFGAVACLDRSNKEVRFDSFRRFPEKTNSGDVLSIRHLLSHVQKAAAVLVLNNFLFRTTTAERELKRDLIERGWLKAVVSLPAGVMTVPGLSLLLLDKTTWNDDILFVDASSESFQEQKEYKSAGSPRFVLANVEELKKTIFERTLGEHSQLVPRFDCVEKNDCNIQVDRYVSSTENQFIFKVMSEQETEELDDLARLIRPQLYKSVDDTKDGVIEFLEVAVSDIDEDGLIKRPKKRLAIKDRLLESSDQRLRAGDVLLAIKGSVGAVGLVPEESNSTCPWLAGQSFIIVRPKRDRIEPVVLFNLLRSPLCKRYIQARATGTAVRMIQIRDIKTLPVLALSNEKQDKIRACHKKLLQLYREVEKLQVEIKHMEDTLWREIGTAEESSHGQK